MLKLKNFFEILSNLLLPRGNILNQKYDTFLQESNYSSYKPFLKEVDFIQDPVILDHIWICTDYQKFGIANLLRRAKILSEWSIAAEITNILIYQFKNNIQAMGIDINKNEYKTQICLLKPDYITFVPPDPKRLKKRGYHIPQIIAKTISKELKISSLQLVQKIFTTKSQTELNREERLNSLNRVFIENNSSLQTDLNNKEIWLVDDFTTTGTSLYQTAKIINLKYPKVRITAIAIGGIKTN